VVTTGLVFGVLHGQLRFLPVSLLGFLMGYMVMRSGSLLAGILAHSIHNLTVLCLSLVLSSHTLTAPQLAGGTVIGGAGLVIFLARFQTATAGCARIVKRRRAAFPPLPPGGSRTEFDAVSGEAETERPSSTSGKKS
jgi:hypothetical protein